MQVLILTNTTIQAIFFVDEPYIFVVVTEGYSGGALKHGPFALIEGEKGIDGCTPVIAIILDDDHAVHMRTAAEEVTARINSFSE